MIDISVIIVNFNTCKVTLQCLDSIFKYTEGVNFEVIVVDNASTRDNSQTMLSRYPGIIYIQSDKNLGFGKANNLGYKTAKGRYILLLNSDTYFQNNALKIFVDTFDKLPQNVACIGAQLLSPEGFENNSFGELPSFKNAAIATFGIYLYLLGLRKKGDSRQSDKSNPFDVEYVMGADLCLKRDVIEENGMFDPDFFMYYEESEMQYRYKKAGWKAMIIPGPKIVHLECISTKDKSKKIYSYANRRMFLQGQFLYFRKRYSYPVYLLFRIMFLLNFPLFLRSYYSFAERLKLVCCLFSSTRLSL